MNRRQAPIWDHGRGVQAGRDGPGRPIWWVGDLILDGTTTVNRRSDIVAEVQDDNGPPFMVLTLKAGGSGLNLTAATHVVHFDLWWNLAQRLDDVADVDGIPGTLEDGVEDAIAAPERGASIPRLALEEELAGDLRPLQALVGDGAGGDAIARVAVAADQRELGAEGEQRVRAAWGFGSARDSRGGKALEAAATGDAQDGPVGVGADEALFAGGGERVAVGDLSLFGLRV